MKELFIVIALLLVGAVSVLAALRVKTSQAASCGNPVASMDSLDFINKSDRAVTGVYLSNISGWGANIVGGTPLAAGERRKLQLDRGFLPRTNDVKIVYEDGGVRYWKRLPIRGIFQLTNDERGEPRFEEVVVGT